MELQNLGPLAQLRAGRLPRRVSQLVIGLGLYGVSMALMIRAGTGMMPWDVFHYGVARHLPLSVGAVVILISAAVLVLWVPLRQAPGLGTVLNAVLIGVVLDLVLPLVPQQSALAGQLVMTVAGILLNALATALYIGSQLGPGPRDGLMTGLARRTGTSLRLVRTGLEVLVVALGWWMGGVVGLATVGYALAIGPLTQAILGTVLVRLPTPELSTPEPSTPEPFSPEPSSPEPSSPELSTSLPAAGSAPAQVPASERIPVPRGSSPQAGLQGHPGVHPGCRIVQ